MPFKHVGLGFCNMRKPDDHGWKRSLFMPMCLKGVGQHRNQSIRSCHQTVNYPQWQPLIHSYVWVIQHNYLMHWTQLNVIFLLVLQGCHVNTLKNNNSLPLTLECEWGRTGHVVTRFYPSDCKWYIIMTKLLNQMKGLGTYFIFIALSIF